MLDAPTRKNMLRYQGLKHPLHPIRAFIRFEEAFFAFAGGLLPFQGADFAFAGSLSPLRGAPHPCNRKYKRLHVNVIPPF